VSQHARSSFSALRYSNFRAFWLGNLVSGCGTWMQNLAQGWLLLKLSNSVFLLGVAGFASLVPMLIFSLFGGSLADRLDRRKMLIGCQIGLMLSALLLAVLTSTHLLTSSGLIAIILLTGTGTALSSPAYQALIADLVPAEALTPAIALNSVQFNVARIVGHSVAGLAVIMVGEAGCFYINALSYLAMIYGVWRISVRQTQRPSVNSLHGMIMEGITYVRQRPSMLSLILTVGCASFFGLPYFFLLPAFGRDVLHKGPRELGYLMAAVSVGALAAALLMPACTRAFGKQRVRKVANLLFWLCLVAFSISRQYWLSVLLLIFVGLTLVLTLSTVNNLLQVLAAPGMRGRVMSMNGMATNGTAPVGALIAGAVAQRFSPPTAVASMSLVGLLFTAILVRASADDYGERNAFSLNLYGKRSAAPDESS